MEAETQSPRCWERPIFPKKPIIPSKTRAPEVKRMVEKLAASIAPPANANRQMIEFAAKATRADRVTRIVLRCPFPIGMGLNWVLSFHGSS